MIKIPYVITYVSEKEVNILFGDIPESCRGAGELTTRHEMTLRSSQNPGFYDKKHLSIPGVNHKTDKDCISIPLQLWYTKVQPLLAMEFDEPRWQIYKGIGSKREVHILNNIIKIQSWDAGKLPEKFGITITGGCLGSTKYVSSDRMLMIGQSPSRIRVKGEDTGAVVMALAWACGHNVLGPVTESKVDEYVAKGLSAIVEQLAACNYQCEGGFLYNNIAFIALQRLANRDKIAKRSIEALVPKQTPDEYGGRMYLLEQRLKKLEEIIRRSQVRL